MEDFHQNNKMIVFVLLREDQNEHGYIDTSIAGVYRQAGAANEIEALERLHARQEGLLVEDDESPDGEWQVSWKIEECTGDLAINRTHSSRFRRSANTIAVRDSSADSTRARIQLVDWPSVAQSCGDRSATAGPDQNDQ